MRLRIAIRNLFISESLILIFLIFAYFIWFPYSFIELGGFYKTAFMLIFVDLILGPCLVFFVYKKGKKHLTFDMNFLLAIQLIAFVYGSYSMYLKHPAYAVLNNNKFTVVNVSDLYPKILWHKQVNTLIFNSPKIVYIPKVSIEERNKILEDMFNNGGPNIHLRTKYYKNINNDLEFVPAESISVEEISKNLNNKNKINSFIDRLGGNKMDYAYFPIQGNNQKQMIWVLSRENLEPIGILDIDSTKLSYKKQVVQF